MDQTECGIRMYKERQPRRVVKNQMEGSTIKVEEDLMQSGRNRMKWSGKNNGWKEWVSDSKSY